ncbi:MAG: hypothetical protein Q9182_005026 [Xanthomendoza sp. 2 TL-2023]
MRVEIPNDTSDIGGTEERYRDIIDQFRPDLAFYHATYRDLHSDPELSLLEKRTSSIAANHLRDIGYTVHEHIGGYGLIGVLENGRGPTILLRADMDALPVLENTGLEYASKKTMKDRFGNVVPVMHACGHDPAEELVAGGSGIAQAMVDDGLYSKFGIPKPDVVLGQHVFCLYKAGVVAVTPGPIMTAGDTVNIRVFGKGGHGSLPSLCIDPIVIASHVVVRLQTIVSRELEPGRFGVVTCGKIQAGTASNIIPDYADLGLSIRSYDTEVQKQLLEAIGRIVRAECDASGSLQAPLIEHVAHAPATVNSSDQTEVLTKSFSSYFAGNAVTLAPLTVSEDFSVLATAINVPYIFWALGGCDPVKWDEAKKHGKIGEIPMNHNAKFAPVIEPTLRTGVDALALAALTFLG